MNDTAITIPCHLRTVRGADSPRVFVDAKGRVLATSEDVAAYFGKQHCNVMRDINVLIRNNNLCSLNFEESSKAMTMPNGGIRHITIYNMTRDGLTLLAMGFTGKRALGWKLKYIEAFNAMEAKLAKPYMVPDDEPAPKPAKKSKHRDMDTAIDLVATAEIALLAKEWLDEDALHSISTTLAQALRILRPARDAAVA